MKVPREGDSTNFLGILTEAVQMDRKRRCDRRICSDGERRGTKDKRREIKRKGKGREEGENKWAQHKAFIRFKRISCKTVAHFYPCYNAYRCTITVSNCNNFSNIVLFR